MSFHWQAMPPEIHLVEQNVLLPSANWGLLPGSNLSY